MKYNQTAEMECLALVFSTESSTLTWWWREGAESTGNATQVVSAGGGTVISTEVLGPDQLKSVLSIEVVNTTHDGVYMCVVSTGYYKLTADVLLLIEKGEWHYKCVCVYLVWNYKPCLPYYIYHMIFLWCKLYSKTLLSYIVSD